MKQIRLLNESTKAYGGELLKTRKGRSTGRPLDTKNSMHLVLRSSKAKNEMSFRRHSKKIKSITDKFAQKYGVKIYSLANVGNHLHFHLHLGNRHTYKPFIRAITAAIAMTVSKTSRWQKALYKGKFWDYRPFTRVIVGFKALLNLRDYIKINQLEGGGTSRTIAEYIVKKNFKPARI